MKNNKGFSILELVVSFSLTVIIVAILFELVIVVKNNYDKDNIRTQLVNNQNLLTDLIYSDLNNNIVITTSAHMEGRNSYCLYLYFAGGTEKKLCWGYIDMGDENDVGVGATVSYGDYVATYPVKTTFEFDDYRYEVGSARGIEGTHYYDYSYNFEFYSYDIPIYNSSFKNDNFGLNITFYQSFE